MPTTTDVVVAALDAERARALTDEVRADVRALWGKVLALYEGAAHTALGYPSWKAYWAAEFGGAGSRGDQLIRAGRVARALAAAGLDVPLPANEAIARRLVPVLRNAPEDLSAVWTRAVSTSGGAPTAALVEEIVEPYRRRIKGGDQRTGGKTRQARNLAGVPIIRAHANAAGAVENIEAAIDARTSDEILREWLEHAETAANLMAEVAEKIRARLAR